MHSRTRGFSLVSMLAGLAALALIVYLLVRPKPQAEVPSGDIASDATVAPNRAATAAKMRLCGHACQRTARACRAVGESEVCVDELEACIAGCDDEAR